MRKLRNKWIDISINKAFWVGFFVAILLVGTMCFGFLTIDKKHKCIVLKK